MKRGLRGLLRLTLWLLTLGAITFLGIWVANRWILPRSVGTDLAFPMPQLEGSSEAEVYELCARMGLVIRERPAEFDASLPVGYLLRQSPRRGSQVKPGRQVQAVFSAGPRMVTLPDFRGESERQARLSLEDLGLLPGDLLRCDGGGAAGTILSSRPGPGVRVPLGARVDLLLSLGKAAPDFLMPDLARRSLDGALAMLEGSGLGAPRLRYRSVLDAAPGTILSQSPPAGARLERGRHLELVVASGSD
jgi:eukaryotic-like serine/threonine-protein kinase